MTLTLTKEQHFALESVAERPPRIVDPMTDKAYVLVQANLYDRIKSLLEDDYKLSDTYGAQMESALRAGWDDPRMDDYNDYDAHRNKS